MNSKATTLPQMTTIETAISVDHIKDHIISFLHASGLVAEGQEIKSLKFGKTNRLDAFLSGDQQTLPLTIEIERRKGGQ